MDTVVEVLSSEDEEDQDDIQVLEEVQNISKTNSNPEDIIEIDCISSSQESREDTLTHKHVINPLSITYKQQFEKFYRKCLKLDRKDGMKRILERKLLPAYHNTEEEYLKSNRFRVFLNRLKTNLKTQQNLKFTIVRGLLDVLKIHQKQKKRIQPITLSKEVEQSIQDRTKRPQEPERRIPENYSEQSIVDLDDDDDDEIGTEKVYHNLVEPTVIINQEIPNIDLEVPNIIKELPNNIFEQLEVPIIKTEVPHVLEVPIISYNVEIDYDVEIPIVNQDVEDITIEVPGIAEYMPNHEVPIISGLDKENENEYPEEYNLLAATNQTELSSESESDSEPSMTELASSQPNHNNYSVKEQEIIYWETMLGDCQKKIKFYDEQEVTCDGSYSPYVMVEGWKARSVNIYKKLCQLTGSTSSIWQPKPIRLQVKEDHPPGPARMLEQWLNLNRDGGYYVLPDLSDVIQCVEQAVSADGLDWSRTDIVKEARSLFIQCGTTIQKYRQRREWRDLVMNAEEVNDPADEDPSLQAKLKMNRQIAMKKERDLLEHYTNLELGTKRRRKSYDISENTSNTELASKENNNDNKTDDIEANNSILQEIYIKSKENTTANENNTTTINSNISETLIDSTTPELDPNLTNLDNIKDEIPDSQTDDNHESCIEIHDNEVHSTNESPDFDMSDGHVDSTTSMIEENDNHLTKGLKINNDGNGITIDDAQVESDVVSSIEESSDIKQAPENLVNQETSVVVDGTADFVNKYGHINITEAGIIQLRTIIFNNEPTVTIDISDSDSEGDDVTA